MEKHHINQIETHINTLKAAHATLADGTDWNELLKIIHHPGWTTLAEHAFLNASLESVINQTNQLASLRQGLLDAAKSVGATRAAGA